MKRARKRLGLPPASLAVFAALIFAAAFGPCSGAQIPAPAPPPQPQAEPAPPAPPAGKVLFSTGHPTPVDPEQEAVPDSSSPPARDLPPPRTLPGPPDSLPKTPVTQEERSTLLMTFCSLDVHLEPARGGDETHATLSLRNVGAVPVARIPLQISSSLRWGTISEAVSDAEESRGVSLARLAFTQSPVATDTDHTGYAQEAVLTLRQPLPPGATISLSAFFAGEIRRSAARLELVGTPPERAEASDWDEIAPATDQSATALRGFGNVLWYPVAAPTAALGEGNKLFELTGRQRLAEQAAHIRLRLTVDYLGEPPAGAIFNGEFRPMIGTADDQDALTAESHGVASVEYPERLLGFRSPSLFLAAEQPVVGAGGALSIISPRAGAGDPSAEAASRVQPLLIDWFGVHPISPLILFDHPGDPFADETLLVGPLLENAAPEEIAPRLAGPMSHAWFRSSHPWISEGLAGFMSLLWTERTSGRATALAERATQDNLVALAEPELSAVRGAGSPPDGPTGQPLVAATSPIFFRAKAQTVWWQLRELLGEDLLRQGLIAYRHSESLSSTFDSDPTAMEKTLERASGKDLAWFFADWVYHDRSLPDLEIVQVNPRPVMDRGGRSSGYLVAVEVRNAGGAAAEVSVTVRSGSLSSAERLRIPARSSASTRILFAGVPETVEVNDGSTPELRSSNHTFRIDIHP